MAHAAARKSESQTDVHTPSFTEDEVDYDRDSSAPEVEEVDDVDATYRSTVEVPKSSGAVVEEVETEHPKGKSKRRKIDEEDHEADGPKSFDPDVGLANPELPKWCRFPEPIAFELQDEAGRQDTGKGSSGLMDRYVIRCMTQIIAPMYRSYHLLGTADSKRQFTKKRLDVMSDFTNGDFNGLDLDDMPLDPTVGQMQTFAEANNITAIEAWRRFRGERTV